MSRYTVDDVMRREPCEEYTRERVENLWAGRESLSAREIAELEIPIRDRLWALCQLAPEHVVRRFACDCAERALQRELDAGRATDPRSWNAIVMARKYARGWCDRAELVSAWNGARDAAHTIWDSVWGALWGADHAARFAAARAAAAARSAAARDADYAAAAMSAAANAAWGAAVAVWAAEDVRGAAAAAVWEATVRDADLAAEHEFQARKLVEMIESEGLCGSTL